MYHIRLYHDLSISVSMLSMQYFKFVILDFGRGYRCPLPFLAYSFTAILCLSFGLPSYHLYLFKK